jgi:hypothetical protein
MNPSLSLTPVTEILGSIRESLYHGESLLSRGEDADWHVESAFVKMRLFLEAAGLLENLKTFQRLEATARKSFGANEWAEEIGESYLVWGSKLRQYLQAVEIMLAEPQGQRITKDVIQILRATQYSITDRSCFSRSPMNESEVHIRIEAVLRCVFPDLIHKPRVTKQIKNFEPDTGIPSIRTLIEYKFIANRGDEKRIAEEVLADTRGYVSKDWDQFVYAIYETKRIRPENHWVQLLRDSGVGDNTNAVVISGEEPRHAGRGTRSKAPRKLSG